MSVSQTYRKLNAAKVRQQVSHLSDNINGVPDSQMEALSKLPSQQWQEAWTEIAATAPGKRITGKHAKNVVARRLQTVPDEKLEPEQPLQASPSSYEIGQLVVIHCEDSSANQQCRRYSGCWGVVHHTYESTAVIAVGGEMVRYLLCDLQPIEDASPVLRQVCDRVMNLWQVQNLPRSVRYLLEFYQRRLDFE